MPSDAAVSAPELPRWDLADLYDGQDSLALERDLAEADRAAQAFSAAYAGRLDRLDAAGLVASIAEYERIDVLLGRAASYAGLLFAGDSEDGAIGRFYQSINERVTQISTRLIFFTLELNLLGEDHLAALRSDPEGGPALARWQPFLRDLRVFRPHQLSQEVERVLHEKSVTGASAWSRLFDETMAALRIEVDGRRLTVGDALNLLSDRDRAVREHAAKAIGETFSQNIRLFSLITNTLAKDKEISDGLRAYPRPGSARNRGNMVEDEVVDALVTAVTGDYARLSHRYYAMKARWLGLEKLQHWDRNAPLPDDSDTAISWDQARTRVLDAYTGFAPELGRIAERFFERPWIDAELRPGKSSGAFAHPTVPNAHPYILMNYHGRSRDVMTLAHELGHGIHQVLAAEQGYLMSSTPLTLAETASVFGEMLTFRALLDAETDPSRRRRMLAGKVEDMLNTVVRQIAFYRFETLLHDERRRGELLPERIGELWRQVQTESLGPAFEFTPEYDVFWAYVPHFVHSPFYVYAYAFGDCLVNALYGVFQDGHPGFQRNYVEMLKAGGTKRHKELLAPFGLDASDPAFWRKGLDVIAGFIDELAATEDPDHG
jgi:oligoendopeptidase F